MVPKRLILIISVTYKVTDIFLESKGGLIDNNPVSGM